MTIGAIHNRWGRWVSIPVAFVACLQPLYNDIQADRLFSGEDTRTVARPWILKHVSNGSTIALQSYSVPLPQSISSLRESLAANDALDKLERRGKFSYLADIAEREHPAYRLYFLGRGDEKNRIYYEYQEQIEEGLAALREAIATVEKTAERFYEAETHRLLGELLLMKGVNGGEVERHFQKAIDVACRQGAGSLELRATMSLARLWQKQGKKEEARKRLEEIYNWFTEGFDTPDLKDAKVLLEQLSQE